MSVPPPWVFLVVQSSASCQAKYSACASSQMVCSDTHVSLPEVTARVGMFVIGQETWTSASSWVGRTILQLPSTTAFSPAAITRTVSMVRYSFQPTSERPPKKRKKPMTEPQMALPMRSHQDVCSVVTFSDHESF